MNALDVSLSMIGIVATGVAAIRLITTQHRANQLARAYTNLAPQGGRPTWGQIESAPEYIRSSLTLLGGRRWEWLLLVIGVLAQGAAFFA